MQNSKGSKALKTKPSRFHLLEKAAHLWVWGWIYCCRRVDEFVRDLNELQHKLKDASSKQELKYSQQQQQMAMMNSNIGSSAGASSSEKNKTPILPEYLLTHPNSALASRVSREMYSVLKKKTTGTARNKIKTLSEKDGVETWRLIQINLCNMDDQHIEAE